MKPFSGTWQKWMLPFTTFTLPLPDAEGPYRGNPEVLGTCFRSSGHRNNNVLLPKLDQRIILYDFGAISYRTPI